MVVDVPAAAVPPIVLAVIVVPYAGAFTVTAPVAPETDTFVPATMLVTPVLLTLSVVVPLIPIPVPAARLAETVGVVVPVTVIPLPAVTDVTPAAPPPLVPSGPDIVIRSPNRRR
jgi:hypothetical protein